MEKEYWKDVEGYEGIYQVSSLGRVKSLEKTVPHPTARSGYWTLPERLIALIWNKKVGYFYVTLSKNDRKKSYSVHRLVAGAFCERPEGKDQVDHINGDRQDNRAINLRWCTGKEKSNKPATSWKGPAHRVVPRGAMHTSAVAVRNKDTKELFGSIVEAANAYGVSRKAISQAVRTGCRSAGYYWEYAK